VYEQILVVAGRRIQILLWSFETIVFTLKLHVSNFILTIEVIVSLLKQHIAGSISSMIIKVQELGQNALSSFPPLVARRRGQCVVERSQGDRRAGPGWPLARDAQRMWSPVGTARIFSARQRLLVGCTKFLARVGVHPHWQQ
jgi:hypothetical protein